MNRRFLTSSIVLIICCLFIVSCNEQHHIGESLNPENSSVNNDVADLIAMMNYPPLQVIREAA